MLGIQKLVAGQLQENCYLVFDKVMRESLIIDPGDEAEFIIQKILGLELKPVGIIATHGHFDHIMAVNELKLAYKIPFFIHKGDKGLLRWYRRSALYFTGIDPGPAPQPDNNLARKSKFQISNTKLSVIETPGHTPGGVCLYSKEDKILFSGDTIFANGEVGRTDLPYSSKADLDKSIKKLLRLPGETVVYPGHGKKFCLSDTKVAADRRKLGES